MRVHAADAGRRCWSYSFIDRYGFAEDQPPPAGPQSPGPRTRGSLHGSRQHPGGAVPPASPIASWTNAPLPSELSGGRGSPVPGVGCSRGAPGADCGRLVARRSPCRTARRGVAPVDGDPMLWPERVKSHAPGPLLDHDRQPLGVPCGHISQRAHREGLVVLPGTGASPVPGNTTPSRRWGLARQHPGTSTRTCS
jgi:hypothetical protein